MRPLLITALLLIATSTSFATTFSGPIIDVLSSASPANPSTNTRVSIFVNGATSCSAYGLYSYDEPSGGLAATWMANLLAAIALGRSITVYGTGTCDPYDIEIVSGIKF